MRAKEFIIPIFEADGVRNVYSVGDSHADLGGIASYKGVINRANGGQASTSRTNYGGTHSKTGAPVGLDNIPPNQIVIIAQGANDTANSMARHRDTKGKTPLVPPQKIASDVARLVSAAQGKGHIVVFVLFPNGPGRGSGLAQYYGGDYQEEVRQAIKSAISVPIVDLNGRGLKSDGIHATLGAYMSAAKEAIDLARNKAGGKVNLDPNATSKDKTTSAPTSDKTGTDSKEQKPNFEVTVPPSLRSTQTADVQKALVALGIPLPRFGVDGIQGKETTGAIRTFQEKNGLPPTGTVDETTAAKINVELKLKVKAADLAKLTPSTQAEVRPRRSEIDVSQPLRVQMDAVTKGKIGQIMNFVAGPESAGHYDMMFGGQRNPDILKMTLEELEAYQMTHYRRRGSSAAGRYQIMHFNTRSYGKRAGLDPKTDKFTPENQDKMCMIFLRECGLEDWLNGRLKDVNFLQRLSQVWAGLPSPSKGGNSFYGGVGLNPYQTQLKMTTALANLSDIKTGVA